MELGPDDLAGVVDVFDALTRAELDRALSELAFKRGERGPESDPLIEAALDSYHLLTVERDGQEWLVVGPTAFPTLPEGGEDLPHIMDDAGTSVPEDDRVAAAIERFRADAAGAVDGGDESRIRHLLDVSYDLEVWGDVEVGDVRERLDRATTGEA